MTQIESVVPRPFAMHWGKGNIVEEAQCEGEYSQPSIQLLEYEDGSVQVRFYWFDLSGRFCRSPLLIGPDDIGCMKGTLDNTPRLQSLLGS